MLYELIQAFVQRVFRDKILMGLVVLGIVAFFMSGMTAKSEDPYRHSRHAAEESAEPGEKGESQPAGKTPQAAEKPEQAQEHPATPAAQAANAETIDPKLATDFINWWIGQSMDFAPQSAQQSHKTAFEWMSPEAASAFQQNYWSPDIANGVLSGRVIAAFQPARVQTLALNPDGSIVVRVVGSLVYQSGGPPSTQQLLADFLIRREESGLRIVGMYCRG